MNLAYFATKNRQLYFLFSIFSGNLFIFDFEQMSFWSFDGVASDCSCIAFDATSAHILIGFRDGQIASVDPSSGQILSKFQAFTQRIRTIVQAPQRPDIILCHTKAEILLFCHVDGTLCSQNLFNVAAIKSNVTNLSIKQVLWTRTASHALAVLCLLNDDSIYVWENVQATDDDAPVKLIKTFELRKHIHPLEWRNERQERGREAAPDDENNNIVCATENFTSGDVWTISVLTTDVSQVAVCCADRSCIVLDANEWKFVEVIRLPKCMTKSLVAVERTYAESILNRVVETVWVAINECDQLVLFEKSENVIPPIASLAVAKVKKICISNDGKLIAVVQKDGQILLLDTEFFLRHSLIHHPSNYDSATLLCENYNREIRGANRKVRLVRKLCPEKNIISTRFVSYSYTRCCHHNEC